MTICFCVPNKFRVKVPKISICHGGANSSTIGLAVAGWVLRVLGVVPRCNTEMEDEVWLLILIASAVSPAWLLSRLPESPYIAAWFTRSQGLFREFRRELGLHSGLVLKLAMRCSTAYSLLALVWPQVISGSNLIFMTWILTKCFLTHVVLKVSVAFWFAARCPRACSA